MKIALISDRVNRYGGVPQYVSCLAISLARNHEVTVFSRTFEGLDHAPLRHRAVQVTGGSAVFQDISALAGEDFDIIHSHHYEYPFASDVLTSHYCEREAVERLTPRGPTSVFRDAAVLRKGRSRAEHERELLSNHAGKPLIVLAGRMKDEFVRHYGIPADQVFVIHSGVDSERYSPRNVALYRDEIRRRHALGNGPVLLLVGGDWKRKGLAEAIASIGLLDSRDVRLLIAGPGDAMAYGRIARALGVADRVVFAGETREAWKYFAAADIFVLPTKYEAFGLVILEAMATGLPVLVSALAGASELVDEGVSGMLIDRPTNAAEIAVKITLLLRDRDLRRRLGANARWTAVRYNWDRVADRTVAVYERSMGRSGRRDYEAAAVPVA